MKNCFNGTVYEGVVTSQAAANTFFGDGPNITQQPQSQSACPGSDVTFTVQAQPHLPDGVLTYQWKKDGQDLSGETANTLVFDDVTAANDGGNYSCAVSEHCCGTIVTDAAAWVE